MFSYLKVKIMFSRRVTPCNLVDANIAEESAASISLILAIMGTHVSHVQALKIHLVQWTSYLKHADLTLTSDTCWNCHWGTCRGVSFETHVQPCCRAPPQPSPHTASSSVKFLLQISNILIG